MNDSSTERVSRRASFIAAGTASIGIGTAALFATAARVGGIVADLSGRTSLPGFFAVGEVACTGVHGANRLASNSLTEGVVAEEGVLHRYSGASAGVGGRCIGG